MYECVPKEHALNPLPRPRHHADVAATLPLTSINSTNGTITVCPGVPISLTCTHDNDNSGVTRWTVTNTSTANCEEAVAHVSLMPLDVWSIHNHHDQWIG